MMRARRAAGWLAALALLGSACGAGAGEEERLPLTSVFLGTAHSPGRMMLAFPGQWLDVQQLWMYQAVYWRGRDLVIERRDRALIVRIDGGAEELASLFVETPADLAELERLLAGGARGLAVVVPGPSRMLPRLPVLPPDRDLALAALNCHDLDVGALTSQTGIETLKIADASNSPDLGPLTAMKRLRSLALHRCRRIEWPTLAELTQLEALDLDECGSNCNLAIAARLPKLLSLRVTASMGQPRGLPALAGMTRLRRLTLRACERVEDLSFLAALTRLEGLEVSCKVADISPIGRLKGLRWLSLANNTQVHDLEPLLGLERLTSLSLARCERVTSLAPIAAMAGLTELDLSYCTGFSDLSPLAGVDRKMRLDLRGCRGVADLRPLKPMLRAGAEVLVDERLQAQLEAVAKTDF